MSDIASKMLDLAWHLSGEHGTVGRKRLELTGHASQAVEHFMTENGVAAMMLLQQAGRHIVLGERYEDAGLAGGAVIPYVLNPRGLQKLVKLRVVLDSGVTSDQEVGIPVSAREVAEVMEGDDKLNNAYQWLVQQCEALIKEISGK